jgi:peptidoglycan/LPS O-acetylase OafA/YrhL
MSASLVVFSHLRSIIFKSYDQVSNHGLLNKTFYFFTGLGHQAVIIFFVLSGYLVGGSIVNQLNKGTFNIKSYIINRISRLYIVLLPALFLTVLLDKLGTIFDRVGLYSNKLNIYSLGFSVIDRSTFQHFFASFFMLQNIVLPPLGSNSPLWSLCYEFWYYLMFPCLCFLIIYRKKRVKSLIAPLILIVLIVYFLPFSIMQYFLIWAIGLIPIYFSFKKEYYKYILLALLIFWLTLKNVQLNPYFYDLILGTIASLLVCSYQNHDQGLSTKSLVINEKLSSFSYSLYLVHFPVIMLSLTLLNGIGLNCIQITPGRIAYIVFVTVFFLALVCSYLIALATEFRTPRLRDFLKYILNEK